MKKKFSLFLTVALMLTLVAVPAFAKTSVRPGDNGKVEVTFTYAGNLDANAVYVAGEFNNWLPNFPTCKMKKENGVWTLTTQLEEGKYQYKFTVYGGGMLQWIKDDEAESFEADEFGGQNSVVIADPNAGLGERVVALEKQMAIVNQGFSYHGYARAGYMMNANGGAADNRLPSSFRLGNEEDTYVENKFAKKWINKDDGSWMNIVFSISNKNTEHSKYEGWVNNEDDNAVLQLGYLEAGGMDFAPDLKFMVGEIAYGSKDIHITDNTWSELPGFGAAVMGIKVGETTKLDLVYVGNSGWKDQDKHLIDVGELSQQNIGIILKDIAAPGGDLELQLIPSWSHGGVAAEDGKKYEDKSGVQAAAIYNRPDFYGVVDGFTTVALQYGHGLGAGFGTHTTWKADDADSVRFLTYGVGSIGQNWDVMPQFIYQYDQDEATTITTGARFVNSITKNFAMQYELGLDYKNPESGDSTSITKFTVAPTIKWDSNSFWSRPEARAFVTYATGDEGEFNDEYDDDSGMTYGVQMEVWW